MCSAVELQRLSRRGHQTKITCHAKKKNALAALFLLYRSKHFKREGSSIGKTKVQSKN
jgi:hypothetical protein